MAQTLKQAANDANLNTVADFGNALPFGNAVANGGQTFKGTVVSNVLVLPEGMKALGVLSGYTVAGSVTGVVAPVLPGATLITTQCKVTATGDVEFFGTDAVTEAEVVVSVAEGSLVEETVSVVSDVAVMTNRSGRVLIEVDATVATSTGGKTVVLRGVAPSAGEAALTDAGLVAFNAADVVTQATIKYIQMPTLTVGDNLGAESELL